MDQLAIALLGVTAIYLTQQHRAEWKRYACLFGMAGQPFWLYFAWQAGAWGVFLAAIAYTYAWWVGIRNNWLTTPSQNS